MNKLIFASLLVFITNLLLTVNSHGKELVMVYAYHLKPPYMVDLENEIGLYFEFSRYLTENNDKFLFNTIFIPRKRFDMLLSQDRVDGVLIGVNPVWFKDKEKLKYLWTDSIFSDRDEVVSRTETAFEYSGPSSLYGSKIGGVLGYYYYGVSEAVDAGKIQSAVAKSERSLLEMLLYQRVKAAIVSRSTLNYLVVKHGWQGKFHASAKPHDTYTRHILIPHQNKKLFEPIQKVVKKSQEDKHWQQVLNKYHMN